jgi:hypothetical protein
MISTEGLSRCNRPTVPQGGVADCVRTIRS